MKQELLESFDKDQDLLQCRCDDERLLINGILVVLPVSHLTQVSHSNSNLESSLENHQNETGEIIFPPAIAFPLGMRLKIEVPAITFCICVDFQRRSFLDTPPKN